MLIVPVAAPAQNEGPTVKPGRWYDLKISEKTIRRTDMHEHLNVSIAPNSQGVQVQAGASADANSAVVKITGAKGKAFLRADLSKIGNVIQRSSSK